MNDSDARDSCRVDIETIRDNEYITVYNNLIIYYEAEGENRKNGQYVRRHLVSACPGMRFRPSSSESGSSDARARATCLPDGVRSSGDKIPIITSKRP